MRRKYLLVFYALKDGISIFGNSSISANFIDLKAIRESEEYIKEENNFDAVVITNWKEIK